MIAIADHFVEVLPGWLVDPILKLRLNTSGHKESGAQDSVLNISFDPELSPDRLTIPLTPEQRASRLATPALAHLADVPRLFESDKKVTLASIPFFWVEPKSEIRFNMNRDLHAFKLMSAAVEKQGLPTPNVDWNSLLLYSIRSLIKFADIRGERLSDRYPHLGRITVCIQRDVASQFFGLSPAEYQAVDGKWVSVASREAH